MTDNDIYVIRDGVVHVTWLGVDRLWTSVLV